MKTTVNSSMISALEWNDEKLIITWAKGESTEYNNVPESVYHEFVAAPSVGKYYHQSFKGKY